jgi:hypothetical protein
MDKSVALSFLKSWKHDGPLARDSIHLDEWGIEGDRAVSFAWWCGRLRFPLMPQSARHEWATPPERWVVSGAPA